MKHLRITYLLISICIVFNLSSCQKYLDKKPTTDLVVPQTLNDFTRLMDDYQIMNASPIIGEISADNYYMATKTAWQSIAYIHQRNAYIFKQDFDEGTLVMADWNNPYRQIFVANVVLDGLSKVSRNESNSANWDFVKGWALFMRSYAFFNLAQLFAPVYDHNTSDSDLGIPLRTLPGVDEEFQRASLTETYDRILEDLNLAVQLLPQGLPPKNRNRPCKEAALAALARVNLAMRKYDSALENASVCLSLYDNLLNYDDLSKQSDPFLLDLNNSECIWQGGLGNSDGIYSRSSAVNTLVDSNLYRSYANHDLRKQFFFKPSTRYPNQANLNRNYTGGSYPFGGLAVDEMYLIKAECLIRDSEVNKGIDLLNKLLATRYEQDTYVPFHTDSKEDALEILLTERRKELAFRGLRWQDLRRLNKEGSNIAVTRNLEGEIFRLPPNSNLYNLPIPSEEIRLNHLIQNDRYQ